MGVVVYGQASSPQEISKAPVPVLWHLAGKAEIQPSRSKELTTYIYPSSESYLFATPFQEQFNYSNEAVSHTRSLTFLKPLMDGPYFDLESIWDEHTYYEFGDRSVPKTMATMVQEPYVNHIPTVSVIYLRLHISLVGSDL